MPSRLLCIFGNYTSEALAEFVIVDMFAKTLQGTPPPEALKWATEELRKIYTTQKNRDEPD